MLVGPALTAYKQAVDKALVLTWKRMCNEAIDACQRELADAKENAITENQILLLRHAVAKPVIDRGMIEAGF
jgi:hypothetical protein